MRCVKITTLLGCGHDIISLGKFLTVYITRRQKEGRGIDLAISEVTENTLTLTGVFREIIDAFYKNHCLSDIGKKIMIEEAEKQILEEIRSMSGLLLPGDKPVFYHKINQILFL